MAVWQFVLAPIPKKWAECYSYNQSLLWEDDNDAKMSKYYSTDIAWKNYQLKDNFRDIFSGVLPIEKSLAQCR